MALKRDVSVHTTRFQDAKACEMLRVDWVHLHLSCSVAPVKMVNVAGSVLGNDSCPKIRAIEKSSCFIKAGVEL